MQRKTKTMLFYVIYIEIKQLGMAMLRDQSCSSTWAYFKKDSGLVKNSSSLGTNIPIPRRLSKAAISLR